MNVSTHLPLFEGMIPAASRKRRRSARSIRSSYLEPVLLMVAHMGCVAQRQLAREFWKATDGSRQHARELLRRIERQDLLRSVRLYPAKGRSSEIAYWLTPAGCRRLGRPEHLAGRKYGERRLARRRVQYVEVVQARADEGWQLVEARETGRWLRGWATHADVRDERGLPVDYSLRSLVRKRLDAGEHARLDILVRGPEARPELRIIVTDTPTRRACSALRHLATEVVAGPPLELEIVAEDQAALSDLTRQVARAARRRKKGRRFHYSLAPVVPPFGTPVQGGGGGTARPLAPRIVDHPVLRSEPWEPWHRVRKIAGGDSACA